FDSCGLREMGGMTRLARHAVQLVFRLIEERLIVARDVTRQAAAGILRRPSMKTEDQLFRSCDFLIVAGSGLNALDVSLARAMTAFAASAVLRRLRRRSGMKRFIKDVRMDRMTR